MLIISLSSQSHKWLPKDENSLSGTGSIYSLLTSSRQKYPIIWYFPPASIVAQRSLLMRMLYLSAEILSQPYFCSNIPFPNNIHLLFTNTFPGSTAAERVKRTKNNSKTFIFPFNYIYHNSVLGSTGSGQELKKRRRMSINRLRPSKPPSPYMHIITWTFNR